MSGGGKLSFDDLTTIANISKYCSMAETKSPAVDVAKIFEALVDPIRRDVVQLLGEGPRLAGELAKASGVAPSTMSRHLRVLLETGLISDERRPEDARVRAFRLHPEAMTPLRVWLDELEEAWTDRLESFKSHVEREHTQ